MTPGLPTHLGFPYLLAPRLPGRTGSPRPVLGRKHSVWRAVGLPSIPFTHTALPVSQGSHFPTCCGSYVTLHPGSPLVIEAEAEV